MKRMLAHNIAPKHDYYRPQTTTRSIDNAARGISIGISKQINTLVSRDNYLGALTYLSTLPSEFYTLLDQRCLMRIFDTCYKIGLTTANTNTVETLQALALLQCNVLPELISKADDTALVTNMTRAVSYLYGSAPQELITSLKRNRDLDYSTVQINVIRESLQRLNINQIDELLPNINEYQPEKTHDLLSFAYERLANLKPGDTDGQANCLNHLQRYLYSVVKNNQLNQKDIHDFIGFYLMMHSSNNTASCPIERVPDSRRALNHTLFTLLQCFGKYINNTDFLSICRSLLQHHIIQPIPHTSHFKHTPRSDHFLFNLTNDINRVISNEILRRLEYDNAVTLDDFAVLFHINCIINASSRTALYSSKLDQQHWKYDLFPRIFKRIMDTRCNDTDTIEKIIKGYSHTNNSAIPQALSKYVTRTFSAAQSPVQLLSVQKNAFDQNKTHTQNTLCNSEEKEATNTTKNLRL